MEGNEYVCRFNRNHRFKNYEDYYYHMTIEENSSP